MRLQKILIITALTGCMSCQQITDSFNNTFHGTSKTADQKNKTAGSTPSSSERKEGMIANASLLASAETALHNLPAFSGKEIILYESVGFYDDGRIEVKVQNLDNPKYIDSYSFQDDKWEGPTPVQISVHDDIPSRLMKLSQIHFSTAATVYNNYKQKADSVLGAEPTNYVYAIIDKGTFSWYPRTVSGSRERFSISFTKDGAIETFEQE